MGYIKQDVRDIFFAEHEKHLDFLKPFLVCFNINYAAEKLGAGTRIYTYILEAEPFMKDAFGIDKEILVIYAPYSTMEPRTIQVLQSVLKEYPFANRIDALTCFLISDDDNVVDWLRSASLGGESSQIIVPFSKAKLKANKNDQWYIRNQLRENFFAVDLFDYSLPLNDDVYYFGRQQILARMIDSIKRCENRGVFGLRKTGKTSLLFKIDRTIREQKLGFVFFYDCKSPSYRKMHWNQLLGEICDNIAKRLNVWIKKDYSEDAIIRSFRYVVKSASELNKRIVLLFDEIEYISFRAPLDEHWKTEFIDFWQTIWSVQSRHRNLVFVLSGVNPSAIETDIIGAIQNPLFGIVHSEYLQGLPIEDTKTMVRTLGKRMGLKFSYDAVDILYSQYGGHPMLTRLACSKIGQLFTGVARPIDISASKVNGVQEQINSELTYYFAHVISEIKLFYPEEYEMFEMLASGQVSDFIELAQISDYSKHLYDYGLVDNDSNGMPIVNMPVAGEYAAMQLAKREHRNTLYRLVEEEKRPFWIANKAKEAIRYMRQLEVAISASTLPKLFGVNSFPEAEKFSNVKVATTQIEFSFFINICNRCFVEAIENYGKSINKSNYFWTDIKTNYPNLFDILERIKIYRHMQDHMGLKPQVVERYKKLWNEDICGFHDEASQLFCVQQRLLDRFVSSLQIEINRLT